MPLKIFCKFWSLFHDQNQFYLLIIMKIPKSKIFSKYFYLKIIKTNNYRGIKEIDLNNYTNINKYIIIHRETTSSFKLSNCFPSINIFSHSVRVNCFVSWHCHSVCRSLIIMIFLYYMSLVNQHFSLWITHGRFFFLLNKKYCESSTSISYSLKQYMYISTNNSDYI